MVPAQIRCAAAGGFAGEWSRSGVTGAQWAILVGVVAVGMTASRQTAARLVESQGALRRQIACNKCDVQMILSQLTGHYRPRAQRVADGQGAKTKDEKPRAKQHRGHGKEGKGGFRRGSSRGRGS